MTIVLTALAILTPAPAGVATSGEHAICHTRACERRVRHKRQRRVIRPYDRKLERMAWCESRQRWHIATGNGFYGGLQFDLPTWRSVGGRGMPHWASELEQKYRAVRLIHRAGYGPWPVCGYA